MEKRCVITGLGAVTPLGSTVETFWKGIKDGVCGIDYIKKFDASRLKVKIAAEVKDFDPEQYMTKKILKEMTFLQFMHCQQAYRHLRIPGLIWSRRTQTVSVSL